MTATDLIDPARLVRILAMLCLGLLAVSIEVAPLGIGPSAPPSPDLLLCVVVYWTVRRPGSTPILAVFGLGLVRDLLTDVPTGAGALSLVIAAEAIRRVRLQLARSSFLLEWLALGAAAFGTAALLWFFAALTLSQPPYIVALIHQSLYTMMVYPPLVVAFRWGLRISWRKGTA